MNGLTDSMGIILNPCRWYETSCIPEPRISTSRSCFRRHAPVVSVTCEGCMKQEDDAYYMRKCVELARKAIGKTSPNPMVGCVIVKDGSIVGQGFHPQAGQPHAEVFALRDAGNLAENCAAYVSLEPCNHFGRTPPCTEALIRAKVKKVVVGMIDPNPVVSLRGVDRLRNAGIEVIVGVEEDLCKKLNEAYVHQVLTGMPFLTIRYSMSVNGCLMDPLNDRLMDSDGYYLNLLKEYDGLLVCPSSNTQYLQLLYARKSAPLINVSPNDSPLDDKSTIIEGQAHRIDLEKGSLEHMNLKEVLLSCKERGLCSVVMDIRGNSDILRSLIDEAIDHNLVQKFVIEVLSSWEGNKGEVGLLFTSAGRRLKVKELKSRTSNGSILLEGYF